MAGSMVFGKALCFELVQTINPESDLILGVICYYYGNTIVPIQTDRCLLLRHPRLPYLSSGLSNIDLLRSMGAAVPIVNPACRVDFQSELLTTSCVMTTIGKLPI